MGMHRVYSALGRSSFALVLALTACHGVTASAQDKDAPQLVVESGVLCPEGNAAHFSPDGRTLAVRAGYRHLALWNTSTGELRRVVEHPSDELLQAVAWSPDSRSIATGGWNRSVRIWDAGTGKLVRKLSGHWDNVESLVYAPDGKVLVSGGADGTIRLWSPRSGDALAVLTDGVAEKGNNRVGSVMSLAIASDGKLLAGGYSGGMVRLWDLPSRRLRRRFEGHRDHVGSLAFGRDGASLVTGGWDRTLRTWDLVTGAPSVSMTTGEAVHSLALSPNGKTLATAGASGKVTTWDLSGGKQHPAIQAPVPVVHSLAFSPDGNTLAVGGAESVSVMDTRSGKLKVTLMLLLPLKEGESSIEWLAHTPQGFFDGSPGSRRYLRWKVGDRTIQSDNYLAMYHRPDQVTAALRADQPR